MAKPKKTPRPKAENPKGFRDYFGADVTERAAMLETIAAVYRSYGFEALESPAVETLEALGKYLPDVDRPHAGVFAWAEDEEEGKGDWLALRYDLTAPLARVYAQHRQASTSLADPRKAWTNRPPSRCAALNSSPACGLGRRHSVPRAPQPAATPAPALAPRKPAGVGLDCCNTNAPEAGVFAPSVRRHSHHVPKHAGDAFYPPTELGYLACGQQPSVDVGVRRPLGRMPCVACRDLQRYARPRTTGPPSSSSQRCP